MHLQTLNTPAKGHAGGWNFVFFESLRAVFTADPVNETGDHDNLFILFRLQHGNALAGAGGFLCDQRGIQRDATVLVGSEQKLCGSVFIHNTGNRRSV